VTSSDCRATILLAVPVSMSVLPACISLHSSYHCGDVALFAGAVPVLSSLTRMQRHFSLPSHVLI